MNTLFLLFACDSQKILDFFGNYQIKSIQKNLSTRVWFTIFMILRISSVTPKLWAVFDAIFVKTALMTIFNDSHRFSSILGNLWWQSLKEAITSMEFWIISAELWQSLMIIFVQTPMTSAEFWAILITIFKIPIISAEFLGNVCWQPLNFGQSLLIVFKDNHHFSGMFGNL